MDTKIKICGITNSNDALAVARLGADEIGFNFYPGSPRYIDPETARLASADLPPKVRRIGVFVDADIHDVLRSAEIAGLDGIQLHGTESTAFVEELRASTDRFVIKAVSSDSVRDAPFSAYGLADAILLDAPHSGEYGGTGVTWNWATASGLAAAYGRIYLAGGLGPKNVAAAIRAVRPYAVDACSGLEAAKGRKDLEKVAQFIREVRNAI